jgi:hypothetical protein
VENARLAVKECREPKDAPALARRESKCIPFTAGGAGRAVLRAKRSCEPWRNGSLEACDD